jgi:hypothetical protein
VTEDVAVLVGGEQGVDRDRHDAGVHCAEESDRPVVAVVHQQEHPLLPANPRREQSGGELPDAFGQVAVAECPVIVGERDLVGALPVELQQVRCVIERLSRGGLAVTAHRFLPFGRGSRLL